MNIITPSQFYDDWASRYDASIAEMGWTAHDEIFKSVSPYLVRGIKIFEIGIGTGGLAQKFRTACGADISGTEMSQGMIDQCLKRGVCPEDRLYKIDLQSEKAPLPDGECELVVSCGVLEYVERPAEVISEAARLTRYDGLVALCYEAGAEGEDSIATLIRDRNGKDENGSHVRGAFFAYKHPTSLIERIMSANGLVRIFEKTFLSTVVENTPIHYHLILACKKKSAIIPALS